MSEFHAEAPQGTVSEGLSQGPYMAVGAGFEPTTLRSTAIDSTNDPPCPTLVCDYIHADMFLYNMYIVHFSVKIVIGMMQLLIIIKYLIIKTMIVWMFEI